MAFSIVQHTAADGFTTSATLTCSATTAGNLLVAIIGTSQNGGSNSFTGLPTGWTQVGSTQSDTIYVVVTSGVFYLANCAAGLTSFTWTLASAPGGWDGIFLEISGAATSSPLDVYNVHNGQVRQTSDTVSTTTTATGDLILGLGMWDATPAALSGFNDGSYTLIQSHADAGGWGLVRAVDQTQTSAGSISYAPSWTGSVDDILWIVAFKAAGGPPPPPAKTTVTAYGRDGKIAAYGRDGIAQARGRDGIVQGKGH